MKRILWDVMKVTVIFICCTFLFYFGLRALHQEYEQYHRYDQPEGPAVKVFSEDEDRLFDFFKFFRLGD